MKNQLIILFLLLCANFCLAQVSPEEKAALLDFYNATGGSNWTSENDTIATNNWDFSGPVTSDWEGIIVDNGSIIEINLYQNDLLGFIPSSLGNLTSLQVFDLAGNSIQGTIPSSIQQLAELRWIDLSSNELNGFFPNELFSLSELVYLDLASNELEGQIPDGFQSLSNLEQLFLTSNKFSGPIPQSIWFLEKLRWLFLRGNQLEGSLSINMSSLANLEVISVSQNKLTGPIPDVFDSLQNLWGLELSANGFSGNIPNTLWSCESLRIVYLWGNRLEGTISNEISNLSDLQSFYVNNNRLSGTVPQEMASLNFLFGVGLHNNNFSGNIPDLNISSSFRISGNSFHFGDFENQFSSYNSLSYFGYSPQSKVPTHQNVTSNSVELLVSVSGTQNHYEWFKNGVAISGAPDSSSYTVPASSSASGAYFCRVTSDIVTGLVIESEPVSVYIAPDGTPRFFTGDNYVYTRTYQTERSSVPDQKFMDEDAYIQGITYFDGLGRPLQQNAVRQAPDQKDLVTHVEYDGYGRMAKKWLPLHDSLGTIGTFKLMDMKGATRTYYQNKYTDDFSGLSYAEINAYSEKLFEPSPLNRVIKEGAPGKDWKVNPAGDDHSIEFEYQTNSAGEVRLFLVTFADNGNGGEDTEDPTLVATTYSYYAANELSKTITKDENHSGTTKNHTTEKFTDKLGRVVLKRTYADVINNNGSVSVAEPHDTYYVYDDFGNLTYVLPPKVDTTDGVSTTELNELCYRYRYDARNRLVEKKIPGKGWEYIVYNALDQPIMTQDANQAAKSPKEWLFTKYDAFGRIAYTGKATDDRARSAIQGDLDAFTENLWVQQSESGTNFGDATVYYNDGAYPTEGVETATTLTEVLTVNYYDNYDFLSNETTISLPSSVFQKTLVNYGNGQKAKTKGLSTGSKVKVLETNDWITTVSGYDEKGRVIYTVSDNEYLASIDIVQTELDFIGKTLKSKTLHTKGGNTIATIDTFTYDHVGRLVSQAQCIGDENIGDSCEATGGNGIQADRLLQGTINSEEVASRSITVTNAVLVPTAILRIAPGAIGVTGGSEELIVLNEYDGLGQLKTKTVGGAPDAANIENSVGLQQIDYDYNVRGWLKDINDVTDITPDKLFSFGIAYNEGPNPLYNGNISSTAWRTANTDSSLKSYHYSYDALNRITDAASSVTGNRYGLSDVSYDKNGNIQRLKRNGHTGIDAQTGQVTGYGTMDDLTYAYTGNQLQSVSDMAEATGFLDGNGAGTDYTYDQNGNVLTDANKGITGINYNHFDLPTEVVFDNNPNKRVRYVYAADMKRLKKFITENGTTSTVDYAGRFIYENNSLQFMNHGEGYIVPSGDSWDYVYQFRDNLGNVRLSYRDINEDGSIDSSEILHERNPYPFGMAHKGYNGNIQGAQNNYADFQGQELDQSLNLNWHHFKYRTYDKMLGRFLQIDPLATTYEYNSTYAFAENSPTTAIDLEGKEKSFELDGNRATLVKGPVQKGLTLQEVASLAAQQKSERDALANRVTRKYDNAQSTAGEILPGKSSPERAAQVYPQSGYRLAQTVGVAAKEAATDFFGGALVVGGIRALRGAGSVWNLNRFARGRSIERTLGANQQWASNFPVIDKIQDGAATSIKSLDLTGKSYQKGNNLLNTLKGYINKLDNFGGRVEWAGDVVEEGVDYTSKTLELAVETGQGTAEQWEQIGKAIDYALEKDINFSIRFID